MAQNFRHNKKRVEEAKRKRRLEKMNRKLNKGSSPEAPETTPLTEPEAPPTELLNG